MKKPRHDTSAMDYGMAWHQRATKETLLFSFLMETRKEETKTGKRKMNERFVNHVCTPTTRFESNTHTHTERERERERERGRERERESQLSCLRSYEYIIFFF